MKQLLVAVFVVFALVGSASAQPGKISFGVGADVALPMSSGFSDTQGIGIGGTAKGYYIFNDMISFTATAGFMTFGGKDYSVAGQTVKAGSWSMIPVMVGGRYYFGPAESKFRLYGAFEMGMIFGSYKTPSYTIPFFGTVGGGSVSTSDFSYQPQLGFEASKFDVAVRLLGVSGATCVAFRAGYIFN
jgi:hypothetical protein